MKRLLEGLQEKQRGVILVFLSLLVSCLLLPVANAGSNPWWDIVKKIANGVENKVAQKVNHTVSHLTANTAGQTSSGTSTAPGAPETASITPNRILPFQRQTIVIRGSGFGHLQPFNGPTCFLQFKDITTGNLLVGGRSWATAHDGRRVGYGMAYLYFHVGGFYITHWTNSEIKIKAIWGAITAFKVGDLVRVEIADPQKVPAVGGNGIVTNFQPPWPNLCGVPAARMFVHVAAKLPRPTITSVTEVGSRAGPSGNTVATVLTLLPQAQQRIVINGLGFGTHAPFRGYSRFLQFKDITANNWVSGATCPQGCGVGPGVDVTLWTNHRIVVKGFLNGYGGRDILSPGDLVRIAIANPQLAGEMGSTDASMGGAPYVTVFAKVAKTLPLPIYSPPSSPPHTSQSSFTIATPIVAEENPPIVLTGKGFGSFPKKLPFTGSSLYLRLFDKTAAWTAGYRAKGSLVQDLCGVHIVKWTDTRIDFILDVGGFLSTCKLNPGDHLKVTVFNPQTGHPLAGTAVVANEESLLLTANNAYVAFDHAQVQNLLDNLNSALHFSGYAMISIVPEAVINTQAVKILTDLVDVSESGSGIAAGFESLGGGAVEFLPFQLAKTSAGNPSLPVLVAQEANNLVSSISYKIAHDEQAFVQGSPYCSGYIPVYIIGGSGQGLEINLIGSDSVPKNTDIKVPVSFDDLGPAGVSALASPFSACQAGNSSLLKVQSAGMGSNSVQLITQQST